MSRSALRNVCFHVARTLPMAMADRQLLCAGGSTRRCIHELPVNVSSNGGHRLWFSLRRSIGVEMGQTAAAPWPRWPFTPPARAPLLPPSQAAHAPPIPASTSTALSRHPSSSAKPTDSLSMHPNRVTGSSFPPSTNSKDMVTGSSFRPPNWVTGSRFSSTKERKHRVTGSNAARPKQSDRLKIPLRQPLQTG